MDFKTRILNSTSNNEDQICGGSDMRDPVDAGWILTCAIWVLTMQGGFAMLETGSIRELNSVTVMVKNLADLTVGSLIFWSLGWGIAFGESKGGFIGTTDFLPDNELDKALMFFQFSFAATAATIVSGAVVERMKLNYYILLSLYITGFIYPVVAHWCWNENGWLLQLGFVDLAGSGVVHLTGGASALVATFCLGPRIGWYSSQKVLPEEGEVGRGNSLRKIKGMSSQPHLHLENAQKSLGLGPEAFLGDKTKTLFGTLLLFFGWFGFNGGSTFALSGDRTANLVGHIAVTTLLGAAGGGTSAILISIYRFSIVDPDHLSVGVLSGLVAITAGAHILPVWASVITGGLGAIFALVTKSLLARFKIDDPVLVVPVHFTGGIVGLLCVGLFAEPGGCHIDHDLSGLLKGGGTKLVSVQLLGSLIIALWSASMTFLFFYIQARIFKYNARVSGMHELIGGDCAELGIDTFQQLKLRKQLLDAIEQGVVQKMQYFASVDNK